MELIQCRFCRAYLPENSRFCGYCGNAVSDTSAPTVNTPIPPGNPFQQGDGVVPPNYSTNLSNSTLASNYPFYPAQGVPPTGNSSNPANGMPPAYPANPMWPASSNSTNLAWGTPPPGMVTQDGQFVPPPMQGQSGVSNQNTSHIVNDDVFDIEHWPFPVSNSQI